MKKMTLKIATLAAAAMVFSASATATHPQDAQQQKLSRVGVVTVSNMTTLTEAEQAIAKKAKANQASHYKVIAVSGNNKLHVSAVIYR